MPPVDRNGEVLRVGDVVEACFIDAATGKPDRPRGRISELGGEVPAVPPWPATWSVRLGGAWWITAVLQKVEDP